MNVLTLLNRKWPFVLLVTLLVASHVFWEYFQGSVTVHHPLADDSLPGISNWWGLLSVPALSILVLWLVDRRLAGADEVQGAGKRVLRNFLGGLIFGLSVAALWEIGAEEVLQYVILLPLLLALFVPVHYPECLLGFVLGMTYTFGGVLPIGIGTVVLVLAFVVHLLLHGGFKWIAAKFK